jgi:hypothetical protein
MTLPADWPPPKQRQKDMVTGMYSHDYTGGPIKGRIHVSGDPCIIGVCFSVARRLAASALISRGTFMWSRSGQRGKGACQGDHFAAFEPGRDNWTAGFATVDRWLIKMRTFGSLADCRG